MSTFIENVHIKDGEYTKTIYTMIKEQRYIETIKLLTLLDSYTSSRPCLSLLAYCYFYTQDFIASAQCYEKLIQLCPDENIYKLYHAQSLHQACMYQEAWTICSNIINHNNLESKVKKLQAAIKYGQEDMVVAKSLVDQCPMDDIDTEINLGCLLYKEEQYEQALKKFTNALQIAGFKPRLSYNVALCYFKLKEYAPSLKYIADIIEQGIKEHPELGVGMTTDGIEVRSVGNTLTLHETALTEAFNLKAAIEYQLQNYEAAKEALTDMPPRSEEELDAVTLHNQALINMDTKPSEGFEKLQFLLQQNPFPPETFANLLLLYCKYQYYDLAADVLAENVHLTYKYLTPYLYDFLDALITQQTSPEEAYRKFDDLGNKHMEILRKATKRVQEARMNHDDNAVKKAVTDYEEALERYVPVLMAQAKIYWELGNYMQVEKIFRKSVEFCNEHDIWKLNVAHTLFMQENKFKEATGFYEPIVRKKYDNILDVSAIVLANLCVSYIMTSQNAEAEGLMKKIEKEEQAISREDQDKKLFHLCIVNLVIGTLYCSKGNYEFGITRVMKSLEPYNKKLGTDTWFYAKRCFLSLLEQLAKQLVVLKDSTLQECIQFLEHCEVYGRDVITVVEQPFDMHDMLSMTPQGKQTVVYEARYLKTLFLRFQMS
ncbi:tetratricopeptide repeat domain 30 isoform X2 [Nomia melanderi]|uniref:tetratricopeptide repeat domain 30 isoform X2 n=1 Tax=Nomia melanderi TaxID=2448451 RepID=UPI0013042C15|nr:tetratricopeptide repeat protein 30A isoform X2 [Nomia melanderi]XP_031833822.1 tetratricopeptide repeat protein 30A isoform X2 [Nomia melanderi]XP_031833823.1 tetratricopeptide repeat protein 30A isoform X2 [Nomia melanderi]